MKPPILKRDKRNLSFMLPTPRQKEPKDDNNGDSVFHPKKATKTSIRETNRATRRHPTVEYVLCLLWTGMGLRLGLG